MKSNYLTLTTTSSQYLNCILKCICTAFLYNHFSCNAILYQTIQYNLSLIPHFRCNFFLGLFVPTNQIYSIICIQPNAFSWISVQAVSQGSVGTHSVKSTIHPLVHTQAHRCPWLASVAVQWREQGQFSSLTPGHKWQWLYQDFRLQGEHFSVVLPQVHVWFQNLFQEHKIPNTFTGDGFLSCSHKVSLMAWLWLNLCEV